MAIIELQPFNRPDLTFRIDAADVHLLAKCQRWHAIRKPRSLTFYIQGCAGWGESTVYLHRLITGAPEAMVVSHLDGDGLNNTRANLEVVTQSVNAARAVNVLKHGNSSQRGSPLRTKCAKFSQTGRSEFTFTTDGRAVACAVGTRSEQKSANSVQTGSDTTNVSKGKAHAR